jgi:plasmid maintenance system killer protein
VQWRVCFRWQRKYAVVTGSKAEPDPLDVLGDAIEVMIVDYH